MNSELKVLDVFEMIYPFYDQFHDASVDQVWLIPGCKIGDEPIGEYHQVERWYTAKYEGKVIYEILSISEMPGKYMDRIIFKKHYIEPSGKKFSNGSVCMLTKNKFEEHINSRSPFPVDYEVEFDEYIIDKGDKQ